MQKLTKQAFIEKSIERHNNKYDYSRFIFSNSNTESIIVCPIHGEFLQSPKDHLRTKGCRKCSGKTKLTTEEFIIKANLVHNDKYDYSKSIYVNKKTKVCIICPEHGEFWQTPDDHCNKPSGCPKCKVDKIISTHSYSFLDFLELADKYKNKFTYNKDDYVNYTTPISIICPIHGEFKQTPSNHINSVEGCFRCGRERANLATRYSLQEFIDKANIKHKNKYDYSKVVYLNSQDKVTITCPLHGDFEQTPANHLSGQGCSRCILKSQTILFQKLQETFPKELFLWEYSPEWLGKQRIDIFIPKYNIAIEYNGIQHYEINDFFGGEEAFLNQIKRDSIKKFKCKENNCTLFEIRYDYNATDYLELINNIQNIITEDL